MHPVTSTKLPPILLITDIFGGDDSAVGLLERSSHPVSVCATLEEAQPHLLHNRPGLILVDMRAPGGNGLDICQALGKLPHAAGIPRLLTLAELDAGTRQKAFASGANDYLALPLLAKEMAEKIAAHLRPDVSQAAPYLSAHTSSAETFNRLAAALPENVIRYDRQGRSVYLSPSLLRVFGPLTSNILGWKVRELFTDGSYDHYAEVLDQVLASGEGQQIEIQVDIPGKQSPEIHQIRFVTEKDEHGQVTGALAIGLDVTERKRIERDLMLLDLALIASSDAVFLMDQSGVFLYVNQAACNSLGYSREELQTMRPVDIDPNVTPESFRQLLDGVLSDGPTRGTFQSTHRHRDGRIFPVELAASVAVLGGEKFCMVIARDITARKAAEEKLHASEQAVRAIVENSPDCIARYDEQYRRVYINPTMQRLIGLPMESLIGVPLQQDSPISDPEHYLQAIQSVLTTGQEVSEEMSFVDPAGQTRWGDLRFVPERDTSGNVVSVLAIGRDITTLKATESRLRDSYDLLQELASRRETAREEERKRIAREIHDELGQRMTALKLKIAVLRLQFGESMPAINDATTMLTDTVDQAVRVIRNLSAMLRPAAIELGVVPSLEWLASEFQRNSGISCELGAMPSHVNMTEKCALALFRIAQESLTNVSRHARASRVRITLEQQDDQYILEVADDGIGFEVQSQGQRTFGLAGIRERMLAVGGDAVIESAPGRGTRVRASLPAGESPPHRAPTAVLH